MQPQPPPPLTYSNGVGSQILASTEDTPHMIGIPVPCADSLRPPPPAVAAEAASPIRSRPNPPVSFDDEILSGGFPDEGEAELGGAPGNRWPGQETLALLKIRSEMDAAFREATLKGPLWEEVSRKLAAVGCKRSAKKCKEKFENVHKYYKRTKEARAGRQDAKTYRFFSQLEALYSSTAAAAAAVAPPAAIAFTNATVGPPAATIHALPLCVMPPSANAIPSTTVSWSASSSPSESNDEGAEERGVNGEGRKRKRRGGGRWMMTFFEGLTKQVMERQEEMQRRFLEAIEQREEDRTIREEAWRRQELALRSREQELLAQERAKAAARDAAIISYLQKIGGVQTTLQSPTIPAVVAVSIAPLPPLAPSQLPPPPPPGPPPQPRRLQSTPPKQETEGHATWSLESPPSLRWPKAEVHALIKLRSGLEARYQETGPKGQLWEEIAAGMLQMGYNRSSKRCKEKWENINKYFKKVKDGSKPRVEDGKTCPYFHQLDALYRERQLGTVPAAAVEPFQAEEKEKVSNNNGDGGADCVQITNNGDHPPRFSEEETKKPEEAVLDLIEERQSQKETMNDDDCDKMEEPDSNTLDQLGEEDDEGEDEEGSTTQYKIQFQQQKLNGDGGGENALTAAAATSVDIAVSTTIC